MNMKHLTIALATGALALTGCKSSKPDVLPPDPGGTAAVDPNAGNTGMNNQPGGIRAGSNEAFQAETGGRTVIYFDTDRYNIDSQDAATLQVQAQWLQRNTGARVTIEGHADERGTRDYNLALGERRANAAKNYLQGLGVSPDRITTVSYGKERPVALGSNESAWAQNRRAVTIVVN